MKFPCKSGEVSGEGAGRVWDVSGAGFWGGSVVASGSTARQRRGPGRGLHVTGPGPGQRIWGGSGEGRGRIRGASGEARGRIRGGLGEAV